MYEKIEHCPICGCTDFSNEIICNDYTVSNEQFVIVRCNACQFLITNPRPSANSLVSYYDSELYISHNSKGNTLVNRIYKLARFFTLRKKQKLIKRLVTKNYTLLDYGCGTGHFISFCKEKGWNVSGVEPNNNARKIANDITENNVVDSIEELKDKSLYQVITLWHVLEHVPDLNLLLKKLIGKLDKKGTLIVAVPNPESWDAKLYKQYWAGYDVPRHLYHFSQENMKQLMEKHKLRIKEMIPMKLDSYYVSMLSEQYKNKNGNYIKSVINGYKSNSYAKQNKNNYSSIIYIIQK